MTPALDIAPLMIWVVALAAILSFGTSLWSILGSGTRQNAKDLFDQGRRLNGHDLRLSSLEQAVKDSPTKDDMQKIALAMEAMRGDVKVMRAELEGSMAIMERLEAIVSRHENHLLDGKK